jgi:hypothetical protein
VCGDFTKTCGFFGLQKIRKRCCKKIFDNYNAIPSLKRLIAVTSFDKRPELISWEGLLALIFRAIARKPPSKVSLRLSGGAQLRLKLRKGNLGESPSDERAPSPNNNTQIE